MLYTLLVELWAQSHPVAKLLYPAGRDCAALDAWYDTAEKCLAGVLVRLVLSPTTLNLPHRRSSDPQSSFPQEHPHGL
jgi:hypothetical protein